MLIFSYHIRGDYDANVTLVQSHNLFLKIMAFDTANSLLNASISIVSWHEHQDT